MFVTECACVGVNRMWNTEVAQLTSPRQKQHHYYFFSDVGRHWVRRIPEAFYHSYTTVVSYSPHLGLSISYCYAERLKSTYKSLVVTVARDCEFNS